MIQAHLATLSNGSENNIEKQIYTEIADYTKSAQRLKIFAGSVGIIGAASKFALEVCFWDCLSSRLKDGLSSSDCLFSPSVFDTLAKINDISIPVLFAGVALSLIHHYTAGSTMKDRHKQMIKGL